MRFKSVLFTISVGFLAATIWAQQKPIKPAAEPKKKIDFNRDIKPILSESCFKCHGPDAKTLYGKLRLDQEKDAKRDRDGYHAIKAGDAANSALIERVTPGAPGQMPPAGSGMKPLTPAQIATLKQWINEGAEYQQHWAFVPPTLPTPPKVKDKAWARNTIDLYILKALENAGMKPEKEADKATLLRRASLTLTGLPPTPAELDAFLKDTSKDAYEKQIDRLLASPRYGENQARFWLDAVRYGDTHGLHLDNERAIYPYRDWVVRAYNQDLPFDKFTEWQFAGDMMPNATTEMKIATGYIRMNPTTSEGGAIAEEFLAKNTFDRVDTTSTVFLGMTVACARCHDHKYDPVSQKNYYEMYAFFNSTADDPFDGNLLTPNPVMKAPSPQEEKQLVAMRKILDQAEASVNLSEAQTWLSANHIAPPAFGKWEASEAIGAENFDKAFETETEPKTWKEVKVDNGANVVFVNKENASAYLRTTIQADKPREATFGFRSDDAIKIWLNGVLIHSNKALRGVTTATDTVKLNLVAGENKLLVKVTNGGGPDGFGYTYGNPREQRIDQVFKSKDEKQLRALYLEEGPVNEASTKYRRDLKAYREFDAAIPFTLVAQELPKPREARILKRGEYNLPEAPVGRALPPALGKMPNGAPMNRLGFAKYLTDPGNPLVGRVFVNRIWQQHFGTGIVKTAEDFGNQGEFPSHPELLDYLAIKFQKEGLSLKRLHKLILTSATFRQAAVVSKDKLTKDPENRLVSRGPRFRLDAEVLRDQALFVSGLLNEAQGGKGFKPYQPAGLWEEIAFLESNTSKYTQDMTDAIYRRSLYLFWKRTSPHPIMLTFDAPMREMCVVRRPRTNTPLQALVTLNEPAFLEAARVFGERLVGFSPDPKVRAREAFRLALGRPATAQELQIIENAAARYVTAFAANPEDAKEFISVGLKPKKELNQAEVAAWTMIASTLFNLDEFLTQH